MEANYYSNNKKNGVQLQEINYNYFTGYNLTKNEYRSSGMQFLGDFKTYTANVHDTQGRVLDEFYYYDTTNGISWSGFKGQHGSIGTKLNRNQQLIIKIDNRPFSIQLTGYYDVYERLWGWLWHVKTRTVYYDYGDVFDSVFTAIKSNNKGYGDYYITVDLSQYFSIREFDKRTGQFKGDNVTDIIKNYAVLKFHYDANGARSSRHSLFGSIGCNPKYDLENSSVDTSYWQGKLVYTLDENSKLNGKEVFAYRFSDMYNGYFLSYTVDAKKFLEKLTNVTIHINLQLAEIEKRTGRNIVGIDYNGLEGVGLDTITVLGNIPEFYLFDNALKDTKIREFRRSRNIVLVGKVGCGIINLKEVVV